MPARCFPRPRYPAGCLRTSMPRLARNPAGWVVSPSVLLSWLASLVPPNVLPFSVRRLKATTVPRSRRPSQTTTVENASGVRCNGWVGRPVLVCCNCTTLGTPLFRGQGRPGPRRWQAIDGFRSVQRFCPSRALERSHRGLRATARRKTVPSGKPIPCGGSTCGREKPVPLGNLSEKDRWKGEESPRVGPYFRTRETTL